MRKGEIPREDRKYIIGLIFLFIATFVTMALCWYLAGCCAFPPRPVEKLHVKKHCEPETMMIVMPCELWKDFEDWCRHNYLLIDTIGGQYVPKDSRGTY